MVDGLTRTETEARPAATWNQFVHAIEAAIAIGIGIGTETEIGTAIGTVKVGMTTEATHANENTKATATAIQGSEGIEQQTLFYDCVSGNFTDSRHDLGYFFPSRVSYPMIDPCAPL